MSSRWVLSPWSVAVTVTGTDLSASSPILATSETRSMTVDAVSSSSMVTVTVFTPIDVLFDVADPVMTIVSPSPSSMSSGNGVMVTSA